MIRTRESTHCTCPNCRSTFRYLDYKNDWIPGKLDKCLYCGYEVDGIKNDWLYHDDPEEIYTDESNIGVQPSRRKTRPEPRASGRESADSFKRTRSLSKRTNKTRRAK